jgi:protein-L-isoaspartate(D-aspartate) O-methyltransferase
MNIEKARFNMIEQQIRTWDVLDLDVLNLLTVVKREAFVPAAYKNLAFMDTQIPLGNGEFMFTPKLEARILQEVAPKKHESVLEVGAGSGYMAALLAARAQHVVTLEIDPDLADMARRNLQHAGVRNVEVRQADGARGLPGEGPFDVIMLSGSVAEVPPALLSQLKIGGRLVAIVGHEPVMRAMVVTRTSDASYATTQHWDTVAPRLRHFPQPSRFHF